MSAKTTFTVWDSRGNESTREVNHVIDIRDFLGTPGYSMLVVAANRHLSGGDILQYLWKVSEEVPGVERSRTWIHRRRWLFRQPDVTGEVGARSNADGMYDRAIVLMRENTSLSVRQLAYLLKENGIQRSSEWVRQHRCDPPPY